MRVVERRFFLGDAIYEDIKLRTSSERIADSGMAS